MKVVHYSGICLPIKLGEPALVIALDHPDCSNYSDRPIRTTPVVAVGQNGMFTTHNTVYKPSDDCTDWAKSFPESANDPD